MTVVGIDVSKGKSMVAAMKPGGELVAAPYEVRHSDIELSHLALDVLCMEPDTRVVMEATGRYHEPVAALLHSEGNGTRAFVIPAQPESHIKTAEMSTEQNYNMIDGMMNNAPSMEELEARAKAGEQIFLLDVAEAAKAEAKKPKQTRKTTQKQKKPSIRAQLAAAKEEQKKRPPAREKSKEMEV